MTTAWRGSKALSSGVPICRVPDETSNSGFSESGSVGQYGFVFKKSLEKSRHYKGPFPSMRCCDNTRISHAPLVRSITTMHHSTSKTTNGSSRVASLPSALLLRRTQITSYGFISLRSIVVGDGTNTTTTARNDRISRSTCSGLVCEDVDIAGRKRRNFWW